MLEDLQYPYEQDEGGKYYSGYDNQVHEGNSHTAYSVWVSRIFFEPCVPRSCPHGTHSEQSGLGRCYLHRSASQVWCRARCKTSRKAAGCPRGRTSWVRPFADLVFSRGKRVEVLTTQRRMSW